jgi:hypothetical protein
VVADQHQLRSRCFDVGGQAGQVDVVGHPDLVADDHRPVVEGELPRSSRPIRLARVRDSPLSASMPRARPA